MVAGSPGMRAVVDKLSRAARSDATVLIQGETGTGKEATAEAVHVASPRRDRPFIVVDCGALPGTLLESELFGHERGSFTGAVSSRAGAFEAAHGGTVFLDEIGELELDLQPKLLRAIERRLIKRVGADDYRTADVRIIAATNRDLRRDVEKGTFRSDLFFRLAVVSVRLPPLRERLDDLPNLVRHILQLCRADVDMTRKLTHPGFIDSLGRYSWPGNVRELRNHLESCLALGEALEPGTVDPDISGLIPIDQAALDVSLPLKDAREACLRSFEKRYLEAQLRRHHDNVSAAARAAGVDRAHFYRLLWKHGLREPGVETTREIEVFQMPSTVSPTADDGG